MFWLEWVLIVCVVFVSIVSMLLWLCYFDMVVL